MSRPGESLFAIRARAYTAGKRDARRELARELRRRLKLSRDYWRMMDKREPSDRHRARALELEDVIETLDRAMRATRGR